MKALYFDLYRESKNRILDGFEFFSSKENPSEVQFPPIQGQIMSKYEIMRLYECNFEAYLF
jgi:hypothetical protein